MSWNNCLHHVPSLHFPFLASLVPFPLPSCLFTLPLFPFYLDYASVVRPCVATFSSMPHYPEDRRAARAPSPLPDVVVGWRRTRRQAVSAEGIACPSWNSEGNVGAPDRRLAVGFTARRLRTQCHQWGFASSSVVLARSAERAMDGR